MDKLNNSLLVISNWLDASENSPKIRRNLIAISFILIWLKCFVIPLQAHTTLLTLFPFSTLPEQGNLTFLLTFFIYKASNLLIPILTVILLYLVVIYELKKKVESLGSRSNGLSKAYKEVWEAPPDKINLLARDEAKNLSYILDDIDNKHQKLSRYLSTIQNVVLYSLISFATIYKFTSIFKSFIN